MPIERDASGDAIDSPSNLLTKEIVGALEGAADFCLTCPVVGKFGDITHELLGKLAIILQVGMVNIFIMAFPLWFVFAIFQTAIGESSIQKIIRDFIYAIIAFILLKVYGSDIVGGLYKLSLDIIGSTAQLTFIHGEPAVHPESQSYSVSGIVNLVYTVEMAVKSVFLLGWNLILKASGFIDTIVISVCVFAGLFIPYFGILAVFFSKVLIAMFRVMMLAIFAPLIMFCFAFNWGRSMAASAAKTLFSALLIIFACTASMALLIYGANVIADEFDFTQGLDLNKVWPQIFILAMLGWAGIAFMLDAVGIANSLSGSVLSNLGAGMLTAGMGSMAAAGMRAAKGGVTNPAKNLMKHGAGLGVDSALNSMSSSGTMGDRFKRFREIAGGRGNQ